jgi:predicted transcriptional regulator
MALNFGDEISLFHIKNYSKNIRCYMYIVNVKELIENNEEIQSEIGSINNQFFKIIYEIIETNCKQLKYDTAIEKFKKKENEYSKKVATFLEFISKLDEEEKKEIKKYKGLFQTETSMIKKNSLENEYQKIIGSFTRKKYEKIEAIVDQTYIFHIFFMLLEEISFDNFVMTKRTTSNIEKMNALFD